MFFGPGSKEGRLKRVRSAFSVHKNGTNQTGIVSATYTLVTWSNKLYDKNGDFNLNTSSWRPPPGKITLCSGIEGFGTITLGATCAVSVYKNGADFRHCSWVSATNAAPVFINIEDVATGNDTYAIYIFITVTAGTASVLGTTGDTWLMGHWIGP